MRKHYYSNEDGMGAYKWIPEYPLQEIIEQIQREKGAESCLLIDETHGEVLHSHRMHLVLGTQVTDLRQLHGLIAYAFYRLQYRCYGRAVHEILDDKKNAPHVQGPRYEIVFPVILHEPGTGKKGILVRQVTQSIYIVQPRKPRVFASINTYAVVGEYFGDLFYIDPRITENGRLLHLQTAQLKRIGSRYISTHLPFTSRELDVLELLADNNSVPDICRLLGKVVAGKLVPMAEGTLIKHRSRISRKAKALFQVEIDSKKAAIALRMLRLL